MPKKVTAHVTQQWRAMAAEGTSYGEIAKTTGWDRRTVARYLEQDIRSSEATRIRQDLFKERLGEHWDRLIDGMAEALSPIRPSDPADYQEHLTPTGPDGFNITGGIVRTVDEDGIRVGANAKGERVWQLLQEHLPRDPLWVAVKQWEDAVAEDIKARRTLYQAGVEYLKAKHGWSMSASEEGVPPTFLPGMARLLYHTTLTMAVGIPIGELQGSLFIESEDGLVTIGGRGLAIAKGRRLQVHATFTRGISKLADSTSARVATEAYSQAQAAVADLRRAIEDISLLRYLPGVCTICGRVEV